ncbi:MAG: PAS domain-containing protein [Gemmatimonadota bacterium]|nr:PAS domain-containing protein [Gemmatimonadota bacterium]
MGTLEADLPALTELLGHAADGIVLTDGDARIRWASAGISRLFGYDPDELIGRDLHTLLPARFREIHRRWMKAFRDGEIETKSMAGSRVVAGLHRSGREIAVAATISRLEGGRTLGVCLHDATERAALELAQAERLERARQLAEQLPVLVSYLDRDLRYRFVNSAYAEWIGIDREALEGRKARSVIGEEGWKRLEPHLRRGLGGEPSRIRTRLRDAESRAASVDVLVTPAEDPDGSISGLFVAALPVPGLERAELLRTVLAEAGRLLSSTVDPFLSLTSVVQLASRGFAERAEACIARSGDVYRVLRSERDTQTPFDMTLPRDELPEEFRATLTDGVSRCYSTPTDRWTHMTQAIPVEGAPAGVLRFSWTPPFDPGREDQEIAEDLAGRIGTAFERTSALRQAREATLQRDWMLERVLHDLSGPTASIWMVADRMLRSAPDPDRRRRTRTQVEGIAQQAKELERLILDLSAATKLRAGHAISIPESTEVEPLMNEVIDILTPLTTWHETNLGLAPGRSDEARVRADPYHLRRLMSALVMNAVRLGGPGESVEIGYQVDADGVTVAVRGPEAACRDDYEGGAPPSLDLAVAREIARSQGAPLELHRDGPNCLAMFTLPRAG